jgi:hypothetical protein
MPRKRTLIPSPLAWSPQPKSVPPPLLPVLPERGGTQLHTPLPIAIIDTRAKPTRLPALSEVVRRH